MLSQEAATEAQVIVDDCAPFFLSFINSGGKGCVDPVTKKPCRKTAWAHQSQDSTEMRALGLTKADFLPSQVEATQHGLSNVLRGIIAKYGDDALILGSSVGTNRSGPNSNMSTIRLETYSAQKANASSHLVCTQQSGFKPGSTPLSEVVEEEIKTSFFESSCTMIHTATDDIGVPATLENCTDGLIVNWNERNVGQEPQRQLCTFCDVENAAYFGRGMWNWHVCGAADCLSQARRQSAKRRKM